MKAIICEGFGEADVLKIGEVDFPIPNENEIIVKIEATAVNRADIN